MNTPTRCVLVSNRSSTVGVLRMFGPFWATMALSGLLGVALQELHVEESPWIIYPWVTAVLAALFVPTFFPRRPRFALDLRDGEIDLVDTRSGARLATVTAQPGIATRHRVNEGSRVMYPAVSIRFDARRSVTIGVHDPRFVWGGEVPRAWTAPRYLVGPAEWSAITRALGMGPALPAGGHAPSWSA
jgi:hypothetical protein